MSVDTKRLRERLAAATPGPWRYLVDDATVDGMIDGIVDGDGDDIVKTDCGIYPPRLEDAQLIAALRNEAPALLDELEKLRAVHGIVSQESELDRLRRLEAADTAWPLLDVLQRLADATEHGLTAHDCDHHGHESDRAAIAAARRIIAECRAAKEGDRG